MPTNTYESPLSSRYASPEMLYLFSADKKFTTWRAVWIALAGGDGAGTAHHPGPDRRAGGAQG